uniref:Uncharacterized protein n=1 Tax=Amphimedon queenslandica TaxID=400682 RepID=A0A1X7V7C5_AMPQE
MKNLEVSAYNNCVLWLTCCNGRSIIHNYEEPPYKQFFKKRNKLLKGVEAIMRLQRGIEWNYARNVWNSYKSGIPKMSLYNNSIMNCRLK